jgi:cell division protein FtsZ
MAAQNAIANPLLDETSLKGAKAVLVNITGGMDMTLLEVDEAANAIAGEVDSDANIIFGAAFDPALDGKIRVSVVATGMEDLSAAQTPSNTSTSVFDTRRPTPSYAASRAEPVRQEAVREPARDFGRAEAPRQPEAAPIVPTFQSAQPAYGAVARAPEPRPEPVIHVAEERTLEPIVDPWVEEYESSPRTAAQATAPVAQGDLYMDRAGDRPAAVEPEPRRDEAAYDDHDDRDHRKSGWSLFGRGKRQPSQPTYAAPSRATEMRATSQVQPSPEPEQGQAEDDLEIPSFLRRLAN